MCEFCYGLMDKKNREKKLALLFEYQNIIILNINIKKNRLKVQQRLNQDQNNY